MKVDYKTSYYRDVKKISDPVLKEEIRQAIMSVKNAVTPKDITKLKKVRGDKSGLYYRIRVGDYRIGISIVGNMVTFHRFGHRSKIYTFFP